jgi:ParB family chromosome partitioning protein
MGNGKREKTRHLGRGLQSLLGPIISEPDASKPRETGVVNIPNLMQGNELRQSLRQIDLDDISPNPYQPRGDWDQQEIEDLAESIRANGVIQPVIVRPQDSGFQLIAGERRFRAAGLADLKTIPALVRNATDQQLLEFALVENIHRADLNPVERARAYRNYIDSFSLTQAEAAQRLGQNRSAIANYLRLLDLPDVVQRMLCSGELSMGHARAILALPGDELRRKIANRAMAGRLSVRKVEMLVRRHLAGGDSPAGGAAEKPAHISDLESNLSRHLGTRVSIQTRRKGDRGRIIIEFSSLDEFDRIARSMGVEFAET